MSLQSPQLQAFMAVTKCKTVHGAAEEIFLTQTAVTQRIRSLERTLKATLFIRTRRGMLLTAEGEALLRYCQAANELEGVALASITGAGIEVEAEVSIVAPTSFMRSRVIPSVTSIMSNYPNLLLHFDVNDSNYVHQILRSGQCDFAVISEENLAKEMQYQLLEPEKYILVCSAAWKGRKLHDILRHEHIIDFDQNDQVTFNYLRKYNLISHAKTGRHYMNRTENLALLVSQGLGYTTLAEEFAKPYIDNKQLIVLNSGKSFEVNYLLAWYDRPEPPRYFSEIINAMS